MSFSIRNLTKGQYIWAGIILLVLFIIFVVLARNGNSNGEQFVVGKHDVVEEVAVSGRVEAGIVANLGFEVSGRVASVGVSEGDVVVQGETLVSLDLGTLSAELAQAKADVLIKQAETANAETNLKDVVAQQDTLVASAYRTLLSSGLTAVPNSDSVTVTPPQISGRYTGLEGRYKIRILKQDAGVHHELYVFGFDEQEPIEINDTGSTRLGSHGLFVSFPDGVKQYDDTIWHINIPNVDGTSYTQNLNAYEEALTARKVAIESAQAKVLAQQSGTSIAEAELARARADVLRVEAEIAKRRLAAPFSGIVTAVEIDLGEIVSANTLVVSLISEGGFGIEIDLPEIDSVKVKTGDPVSVTLDAFGDDVLFKASVVSVNRTETIVDNVAVYEARLAFDEDDERIASGMTADVVITTDTKEDAIAVPSRALRYRDDGTPYVYISRGGEKEEKDVSLGLRGSDGFVEVTAGLSEGDTVLIVSN